VCPSGVVSSMTTVMRFSMVLVVGLLVVFTPLQVAGAGGNGKSPKSPRSPAARVVATPEITMSEGLHAIGRAVLLLGRHMDMPGVAAPTIGMRVWAMFGSLSQRLAGHFFYPAVVMAVRISEGLDANAPTVLLRWFNGFSSWTNVDFRWVHHRTEHISSDETAFDILYPPATPVAAPDPPSALAGSASASVNLADGDALQDMTTRMEDAESDNVWWAEQNRIATEKLHDLERTLATATATAAAGAAAAAVPLVQTADACTQADAVSQTEAESQTQPDVEPDGEGAGAAAAVVAAVLMASTAVEKEEDDVSVLGPRKRNRVDKYEPHDIMKAGAKHWKNDDDGSGGGSASYAAA